MKITLPSGDIREYQLGTTGAEIALSISEGLARVALGIFVNGIKYDLSRPINEDAEIRIVTFDDPEGKEIFWHSSAHLMAEAVQELYPGAKFGIGPAIEAGFYYDIDLQDRQISSEDLIKIEDKMRELASRKAEYQRMEISWDEAIKFWKDKGDQYKIELLDGLRNDEITFYKQGEFVDLCRGTHVPNTSHIKSIKLMNIAGAYWRGDSSRPMMTRIYGITFPKKKQLDDYLTFLEEAKKRDHKKLGPELGIYLITPKIGGGLPVWLPKGTIIRRKLENFIKDELLKRGYQEVITPHIGNLELYKTSGHYPYYAESQFAPITVEDEEYMLKPMNCPHHHQIYSSDQRSYRDLPIKLAEFGTVYRYEQSGELSGLSRVRGFTQDDAHIYCTDDQLEEQIIECVELTQLVFKTFDMEVTTRLSFKDDNPDKYAGSDELWERAQKKIQDAADKLKLDYVLGPGEASFYGPKIDFIVKDAIGRKWQLGTVQVDYVMPERFQLEYKGADNQSHRPVIIHRAPFGSMERFISILIEHYSGNFPFWLAPIQLKVMPIGGDQFIYADKLNDLFKGAGFRSEVDLRNEKINRKIAESEQQKVPFALIIGKKEMDSASISLREHGLGDVGVFKIEDVLQMFHLRNQPSWKKDN